jgi:hypothetical protein
MGSMKIPVRKNIQYRARESLKDCGLARSRRLGSEPARLAGRAGVSLPLIRLQESLK